MRIEQVLLELGVGGLTVERNSFQPETQGLIMNQQDNLQGDEGEFQGEPKEAGGG